MPLDTPKLPGDYAWAFHEAVHAALSSGTWETVLTTNNPDEGKREQRRYRAFLKSLEAHPRHWTAAALRRAEAELRTRLENHGTYLELRVRAYRHVRVGELLDKNKLTAHPS